MKTEVIKNKDHVLFKNKLGEYHLSIADYDELGDDQALVYAENEIQKKANGGNYAGTTINYRQARKLRFCDFGIKDFASMLDLDVDKTYTVEELNKKLTLEALKRYPTECCKVFGKNTLKYLGGVEGILSEDTIDLVLREEFIPAKQLHIMATRFAWSCLHKFEDEYPEDKAPRRAIEMKEKWIDANYGTFRHGQDKHSNGDLWSINEIG